MPSSSKDSKKVLDIHYYNFYFNRKNAKITFRNFSLNRFITN